MANFSQCPGECYDSFWSEENNEQTINIDELFDKSYKEQEEFKVRIDYYYQNDLERRWKYRGSMLSALKTATTMIESGDYTVVSITTN